MTAAYVESIHNRHMEDERGHCVDCSLRWPCDWAVAAEEIEEAKARADRAAQWSRRWKARSRLYFRRSRDLAKLLVHGQEWLDYQKQVAHVADLEQAVAVLERALGSITVCGYGDCALCFYCNERAHAALADPAVRRVLGEKEAVGSE